MANLYRICNIGYYGRYVPLAETIRGFKEILDGKNDAKPEQAFGKVKMEIVTLERTIYAVEVDQVSLPTSQGEITVLPHHIPLVSTLMAGRVKIIYNGKEEYLAISSGFNEIQPHRVERAEREGGSQETGI